MEDDSVPPEIPVSASHVPPVGEIPVPTARLTQPVPERGPPAVDPAIVSLMNQVQAPRLMGDVNRLVGFGSRHVLSEQDAPQRGIGAARGWLYGAFEGLDRTAGNQVAVGYEDFRLRLGSRRTSQRNIIATLPGIGLQKRFVYVAAHYDSRTSDPSDGKSMAPGADDNASGTAALLEMARILAGRRWDATIRLVALAAAEADLAGSRHHAPQARRAGLSIIAVFNLDTIGSSRGPDGSRDTARVRVYSAGPPESDSRRLARYAQVVGERYSRFDIVVEDGPGPEEGDGDHVSFSEEGFAAVRLAETNEDPARQGNSKDTMDRMDPEYLAEVVRLNLALVANLALAPPAPATAPALEVPADGGLTVRWQEVEDPFVAGYWVALRRADEARYSSISWAGKVQEFTLPALPPGFSPDETVFVSVAASDDLGHTSLFGPEVSR